MASLAFFLIVTLAAVPPSRPLAVDAEGSRRQCSAWEATDGWNSCGVDEAILSDVCSLDRVPVWQITRGMFDKLYRESRPVILTGLDNNRIQKSTAKQRLLDDYGDVTVTLSTANTVSHDKTPITFREYLENLQPQDADQLGNETLYLFGPNSELGFSLGPLIDQYTPPPFAEKDLAFSFGIGASGTGVPFHVHSQGWSEVIHGRKRWFLYPPFHKPSFDPDECALKWLHTQLPSLKGKDADLLEDCVIGPGEALYFPSMWWHAIVNVGETVFMSSFEAHNPSSSGTQRTKQHHSAINAYSR